MKPYKLFAGVMVAALMFSLVLCGCSQGSSKGPNYADSEAMPIIAKGLEARWAITESNSNAGTAEDLRAAISEELNHDKELRDRQFEDPKMQEDVLAYINKLDGSLEVLEKYQYGSVDFHEKWDKVYGERTALLKTFVDKYGLTVNSKYKATLDNLLAAGTAAQNKNDRDNAINKLFENAEWEKTDNGYGYYTYSVVLQNTTDYSFKDVTVVLALYDAENVRAGETYANASSWEKGEKAKFETVSNIDAMRVKSSVQYYSTVE